VVLEKERSNPLNRRLLRVHSTLAMTVNHKAPNSVGGSYMRSAGV
jgi:hypothetical protein